MVRLTNTNKRRKIMKKITIYILILLLIMSVICSCTDDSSLNNNSSINSSSNNNFMPFTELDWNSSPQDAEKHHKCQPSDTYDANVGDKAYVYENIEYDGKIGKITYFFTDDGELVATYFDFSCADDNEVDYLYNKYTESYTKKYGDSDFNMEQGAVCGNVWYEKNGNIGVMYSKFLKKMVRLQYINPKFTENN